MKKPYRKQHLDGTLWAKGFIDNGKMVGHWEWFRKDGSLMRSGSFRAGVQIGDWKTYDHWGKLVRVTNMNKPRKVATKTRRAKTTSSRTA